LPPDAARILHKATAMNEQINWDDILADIEEQQAVLLLGHGFLPGAHEALHHSFREKLVDKLLHFYQRDGLFLFADNDAKTSAQKEAARFYKSAQPDEALLKKIAELPFRLMVSANPDRSLCDAFAKYRLPLQFDYFTSKTKEKRSDIERPTQAKPLLYNLCGIFDDGDSLVLDFDDLFYLLTAMLPNEDSSSRVPKYEVRIPLLKARTFIFLGFHFERWYTQLFLRYLNQNDHQFSNNSRNYALKTSFADPETQQFFLQQFNVKYIGADLTFFEELHRRFSERNPGQLRKVVDTLSPTATTVVQLVERADLAAAIATLKIFSAQFNADDQTLLTTTESRYNHYLKDKSDGTVSQENLGISLSKVRINLLELAKKLK